MKKFLKKYHKGLFATGVILSGTSPTLDAVYQKSTAVLSTVGLDWSTLFATAMGAPVSALIPSVALGVLPYILKAVNAPKSEEELLLSEVRAYIEERKKPAGEIEAP